MLGNLADRKQIIFETMNDNVNRGNSIVKIKNTVWQIKVGVYTSGLVRQHPTKTETKPWKIKVVLN